MRLVLHRLVHRYVGREHGGHRAVAGSLELPRELEQLVQRRSDLSGEDLGRPVGPYLAAYPLPDGRHAFARTRYLTDADCLGAVRTETLLLDAEAQAALPDPFDLQAALEASPEPPDELRRFRAARAPAPLAPLELDLPPAPRPAALLSLLRTLPPALLRAVVEGACGARPLALAGDPPGGRALDVLRALLQLHPRGAAWHAGWCGLALSPRPWAALQLVPREAADRFALRAAREADLALVDLQRGDARHVEPSAASEAVLELAERGAWDALADLAARAGQVGAYRVPGDLAALLRYEALAAAPRRAPEEQVELANHLRARGAPEHEVAAPFRALLLDPPEGRLVWLVNVVQAGWLAYRRAHEAVPADAPEAVQALLLRTVEAQRFDLTLGFLERMGPLYPEARRAAEDAALNLAAGDARLEASAPPGLAALLVAAAERDGARAVRAARALAARRLDPAGPLPRGPLAPAEALARVAAALRCADPRERGPAGLALLDAALAVDAAAGPGAPLPRVDVVRDEALAAAGAPWSTEEHLRQVLRRLRPRRDVLAQVLEALLRQEAARVLARARAVARRAGLHDLARRAHLALLRAARDERGAAWLLRGARGAVRAGAHARAARRLQDVAALDPPGPARRADPGGARTGEMPALSLDDDGGQRTGLGPLDLNDADRGGDDTGVNLAVPEDTTPAHRDVLLALIDAPGDPAQRAAVARLLPDVAFDLPWGDLARLSAVHDEPRVTARLAEAADGVVAAALAGPGSHPGGLPPPAAEALVHALARAVPRAGEVATALRWLELAGALSSSLTEIELTNLRVWLAQAAGQLLGALPAPADPAPLVAAGRALLWNVPEHDLAARLLPLALTRGARAPADVVAACARALEPGRVAEDAPLVATLARAVREGALELDALARLGPTALDAVLRQLGDGFSLRLQNGLRRFVLGLADAADAPARRELIRVALERLRPHVAPDRAFRADVAQGLRSKLALDSAEPLARAIVAFES